MEFSILMPCLNEEKTLASCIAKARLGLKAANVEGEIIIADNGSSDRSQMIARELKVRTVVTTEKGYGNTLTEGIKAAKGTYIIMGDSDDSYDFADITGFVAGLRNGSDIVMGNRFKGEIKKGAMPFLHKYLGNPFFSALGKILFRLPCGDINCGMRGFKREAILSLNLEQTGMEFAVEMLIKAKLAGLQITEVPIILSPDGRNRRPHLRPWRDGMRTLYILLRYKLGPERKKAT